MQTAKEIAHQWIECPPDTATFDEILYGLYARQKIEAGLKAVKESLTIPHDDAKKCLLGRPKTEP